MNPSPAIALLESVTPEAEAKAFGLMRLRIFATVLRQTLLHGRFRLGLVALMTASLWGGLFWMFASGFTFLQLAIPDSDVYGRMVCAVFGAFFAALMLMLMFSSGVILYGSLFCSREVAFLLTTPARTGRVFLHKFQEAILLSSWGFVLLGSPILVAYGVAAGAPWYYYAMLLPYLVAFVYIPVAVGAMLCLWIVRRVPNVRLAVIVVGTAVLVGGAAWTAWSLLSGPKSDLLTPRWFHNVLGRLQFAEQRLLPSWWLSQGLRDAATHFWSESLLFLTLMISNALFFRQLTLAAAARMFRASYDGLYAQGSRRKRALPAMRSDAVAAVCGEAPNPLQLLMLKDLRLFRRDPLQWSQLLVFLGLLAFYFLNIRSFTYGVPYVGWVNIISFLNVAVVGLLLSTFTTRFIFPMISLEGRRFWILGLLPVGRGTLLWSKFLFAAAGSVVPCSLLILLSDMMLDVSPLVLLCHQMTSVLLCLGLAGLAVGLGARLPNLREPSPARIAAGFGGTLTLVLSTLYILAAVAMTAVPIHFYLTERYVGEGIRINLPDDAAWRLGFWVAAGVLGSVLLGAVATFVPMHLGLRALRRMEF